MDADWRTAEVKEGLSSELGCCNKFEPENEEVKQFRYGNCEYLTAK
jgi:hypothetical protein